MSRRKKFKGKQPWVGKTLAHRLKGIEAMYDAKTGQQLPGVGYYKESVATKSWVDTILAEPFSIPPCQVLPFVDHILISSANDDDDIAARVEALYEYPSIDVQEDGVYIATSATARVKVVSAKDRKKLGLQVGDQIEELKIDRTIHDEQTVSFRRRSKDHG